MGRSMKREQTKFGRALVVLLATMLMSARGGAEEPKPSAPSPAPDSKADSKVETKADSKAEGPALDALERELTEVMDALVTARARADVLAARLFKTQLVVDVVRKVDALKLEQLSLRLDDVPVHESDGSSLGPDRLQLFKGHVAPGMHALTVEVRERARAGAAFGYVRRERYQIEIKRDKRTRVEIVLRDDSDIAEQAAEGDDGEYEVETAVRVSHERVRE